MENVSDTVNAKVRNKLRTKLGNQVSNRVEYEITCDEGLRNIRWQVGIVLYRQVKQNVKLWRM
jgi:hypothetical protein